jgi:hypothetical protein
MTRRPARNLRDRMVVLGRQRAAVGRDREARAAYREGRRFVRAHFGDQLVADVVSDASTGNYRSALAGFGTLVRYHPRGALEALAWLARNRSGTPRPTSRLDTPTGQQL